MFLVPRIAITFMSAPFLFVPRSVTRSSSTNTLLAAGHHSIQKVPLSSPHDDVVSYHSETESANIGHVQLSQPPDVQCDAMLIWLALSDYALWSNTIVKEKFVAHKEYFIPLSYLFKNSKILRRVKFNSKIELEIVKDIRQNLADIFDVRMIVPESDTRNPWIAKKIFGYEVRRKDWADNKAPVDLNLAPEYWDDRTLYMESIPPQHRSLGAIARFCAAILPFSLTSTTCVEGVSLLPHYQDSPSSSPQSKGFALVTFSSLEAAEELTKSWPWIHRASPFHYEDKGNAILRDTLKFGLRTLRKPTWRALQAEYVAYRQTLINTIPEGDNNSVLPQSNDQSLQTDDRPQWDQPLPSNPTTVPLTTFSSPYPHGCLVFVRNVHPETNKSALRKLFTAVLQSCQMSDDGIDYVDYNKGIDHCFLRLSFPEQSIRLVKYFTENSLAQAAPYDEVATNPNTSRPALGIESVLGRKEEVYWEKVPFRLRQAAVSRVMGRDLIQDNTGPVPQKRKHGMKE